MSWAGPTLESGPEILILAPTHASSNAFKHTSRRVAASRPHRRLAQRVGTRWFTFANITKGVTNEQALRVRAYWSIRFAAVDVVQFYSKATQALIAANGGESFSIYTNTNNFHGRLFTPGLPHVQPGTGVVTQTADRGGMDWMQAGRYKAGIDMPCL